MEDGNARKWEVGVENHTDVLIFTGLFVKNRRFLRSVANSPDGRREIIFMNFPSPRHVNAPEWRFLWKV